MPLTANGPCPLKNTLSATGAPTNAQRLGISDSIVYKDAVKLGLSLRRAKAA